jgi:UTP-glucose-1-phosphate uridylyltransferase
MDAAKDMHKEMLPINMDAAKDMHKEMLPIWALKYDTAVY